MTTQEDIARYLELATQALELFASDLLEDEKETAVTDLLADIMHWCNAKDVSFTGCLDRAEMHFQEELRELAEGEKTDAE